VPPLVIEWDYGSSVIGDFTWPAGLGEIIVSYRIRACIMSSGFSGISFEEVEMFQKQKLKKPRNASRAKMRAWLPYDGPPLWSLVVTSSSAMDLALSRRSLVSECDGCDRTRMIVHDSASPLFVIPETTAGTDFLRIREMGNIVFVSEAVEQAVKEHRFTNVEMKERGCIQGTQDDKRHQGGQRDILLWEKGGTTLGFERLYRHGR
jgi:hypothetical protein